MKLPISWRVTKEKIFSGNYILKSASEFDTDKVRCKFRDLLKGK